MKFCAFLVYHSRTKAIIKFVHEVYEKNIDQDGHSHYEILSKSTRILLTLEVGFISYIIVSAIIGWFVVLFTWLKYKKILLIIYIPFVDENTEIGLFIHILFDLCCVFMAAVGTIASDLQLCILSFHLWTMTKILQRTVSDFNDLFNSKRTKYATKQLWLLNVAKMHIDYYR